MSKKCALTGKKTMFGHQISHAHNVSKVRFHPNLQKKRFFLESEKKWVTLKVSTSAIRSINRYGFQAYLKKVGISL